MKPSDPPTRPYPLPPDETARLRRLRDLRVLDTPSEPLFDALAQAAAELVGTPMALVSLIDEHRQWFKANVGLPDATETPRDLAFCTHAILDDALMEVPDARDDVRFADNPFVTGEANIRFYAGAPITLRDGLRMGSLCVVDNQPRQLNDMQRRVLSQLARAVAEALDQRLLAVQREAAMKRQAEAERLRLLDQDRLHQIIESMQAGTWEWDARDGRLHVNERWAEIIGFTLEELGELHVEFWAGCADPEDWSRAVEELEPHIRGEADYYATQLRLRHKDGRWIWVSSQGRIVQRFPDGKPQLMYGTMLDISTAKEAERRLRASEALLDRTGRLAGVGGWEVDLASGEIVWSDETCRIHGLPPGFRPTLDEGLSYYPPEVRPRVSEAIEKAIADGSGWDLELPFITADGRSITVRTLGTVEYDGGRPRWLVGAFQDTTLRKRATQALEVSERRFRKLFEFSLGLICTHDLEGTILSVNPAAAASLGYSVAELLGCPLADIMPESFRPRLPNYLSRIITNGSATGLMHLVTKDGRQRIWEYHNTLDTEDEDPYILAHAQDVTERHLHERSLHEASIRDALTGLFNRRHLAEIATTMAEGDVWGCVAVDLRHFKAVNDTQGHQRGDEVLVEMGRFLTRHVRPDDVVIRLGGDEFLLLLRGAEERATQRVCERIRADAEQAPIGFTLGSAIRREGVPLEVAMAEADAQLYAARAEDAATR